MTTGADPDALGRYVAADRDLGERLTAVAARLGRAADQQGGDRGDPRAATCHELARSVRRLAADEAVLARSVSLTRTRLLAADAGRLATANRRARSQLRSALAHSHDPARSRALRALLAPDPATGRRRQFLRVDVGGDGQIVEVIGDLVHAASVVAYVPGAGTDLMDFDVNVARPLGHLARHAERVGGAPVAAVAWLGYDPPDAVGWNPIELLELTSPGRATTAGRDLVEDLADLPIRAAQRLTLIGHSYGSVALGAALLVGIDDDVDVDQVVALGSPGMLVDDAREFELPDVGFSMLSAPGDLVARSRWFGSAPAGGGSGFARLPTNGSGHSSYLRPGGASERSLTTVIIGRVPGSGGGGGADDGS